MDPNELKKQATAKIAEADSIEQAAKSLGQELTAEAQTKIDTLTDEAGQLKAQADEIEAKEKEAAAKRAQRDALRGSLSTTPGRQAGPGNLGGGNRAPEAKTKFENLGEFLHAIAFNPNDQRLTYVEFEKNAADQSTATGSAGGFLVPTEQRQELLVVPPQSAYIRARARVIPAGNPPDAAITFPALDQSTSRYGGVAVDWIEEGEAKPETNAAFREIRLQPKEVAGHIPVTDKLLRNWQAANVILGDLLRSALLAAEDQAFLSGNGVGKPLGVVNSGAAYVVTRQTGSTITYQDLRKMLARFHGNGENAIGGGTWTVTKAGLEVLTAMEDTEGHLIWNPNARDGVPGTIFGMPVIFSERSPALGSKGDVVLADWSKYLIKDGSGPFVEMGYINDDFTKNKRRIKAFRLVDGQPWLTAPIKTENNYDVSPFVVLN